MMAQPEDMPDPAVACRRLLRRAVTAALATVQRGAAGGPYVSLVQVATAHDGAPLLLLSDLADHTKNMRDDARVSLLFDGTQGLDNALTGARVTLQGRASPLDDSEEHARLKARYVARHPDAAAYAGFSDFNFYGVAAERFHLVAGFGNIHWLDAKDVLLAPAQTGTLAESEADILAHMNADHADAVDRYACRTDPAAGSGWRMTAIDPEGLDLSCDGARGRLDFADFVTDAEGARRELVRLARKSGSSRGAENNG